MITDPASISGLKFFVIYVISMNRIRVVRLARYAKNGKGVIFEISLCYCNVLALAGRGACHPEDSGIKKLKLILIIHNTASLLPVMPTRIKQFLS